MHPIRSEEGQTTAEYAVVLGILTLGIVVTLALVAPAFVAVLAHVIAAM